MRRISYYIRELDQEGITHRYQAVRLTEWPDNQTLNKPVHEAISNCLTREEAAKAARNNADWQEIVAADAGSQTEIIHPENL